MKIQFNVVTKSNLNIVVCVPDNPQSDIRSLVGCIGTELVTFSLEVQLVDEKISKSIKRRNGVYCEGKMSTSIN